MQNPFPSGSAMCRVQFHAQRFAYKMKSYMCTSTYIFLAEYNAQLCLYFRVQIQWNTYNKLINNYVINLDEFNWMFFFLPS
jgi:hypothetical protein